MHMFVHAYSQQSQKPSTYQRVDHGHHLHFSIQIQNISKPVFSTNAHRIQTVYCCTVGRMMTNVRDLQLTFRQPSTCLPNGASMLCLARCLSCNSCAKLSMDKDSRTPSLSPVCYSTPDCQLTNRDDSPLQSAAGGLAARHLPGMLVGKLLANCKHEFNKLHKRTCKICRLFCAAFRTIGWPDTDSTGS